MSRPSSPAAQLPASSLDFLKLLKKNNDRDWFNAHKERYLAELSQLEHFAGVLLHEMNDHDVIETPSGKKACTAFTATPVFRKTKHPTRTTGAAASHGPVNNAAAVTIFTSSRAIVLQPAGSGRPIRPI